MARSDGVITRWSFEADGAPPEIKFKVGRPPPAADFTTAVDFRIIGESGFVTPAPNELNSYFVQIPVKRGDVIGLAAEATTSGSWVRLDGDYPYHVADGDVLVGDTETFNTSGNAQFDVSANLETKKCKGKAPTMAGTAGNDTLLGTPGRDVIVGFGGNDTLKGFGGKDRLCGLNGRDKLKGGGANDALKGARGKDRLNGGSGRDTCVGGKSKDTAAKCEIEQSI